MKGVKTSGLSSLMQQNPLRASLAPAFTTVRRLLSLQPINKMESSSNHLIFELPGLGLPLNWLPDMDRIHSRGSKLFTAALDVNERGWGEEGEAAYVKPAETKSVYLLTAPVYL